MIECVPNFSEGRRPEVLAALVAAARAAGARVLDLQADPDHHRSVLTFCGGAEAVAEAAFAVVREAAARIDLRRHRGRHPRLGAADVVPFVPLEGHGMEACVGLARRVGERVGRELGIPVYLYGEAAGGRDLADVRRGRLEELAGAIGSDPARAPDFGPKAVHPTAGATAVGARAVLIAYNIDLASDDAAAARRIARAIRARNGGLPGIKALGLYLPTRRRAQVSVNVCDWRAAGPADVYARVEELARAEGLSIHSSEIVGLVPEGALPDGALERLRLAGFDADRQVLEKRLAAC